MEGIAAVQARIASIEARFALQGVRTGSMPSTSNTSGTSFDAVLAGVLDGSDLTGLTSGTGGLNGTSGLGGLTPAERRAPGDYGRLEPPADLVGYGNGRIPTEALAPLGIGDHRLWRPAANAFQQLLAAARADGVSIGVTDSYRDYDSQVRLAEEKGLYEQGGLAATPGTSNHGWGVALDLDLDANAQQWMRDNGWRFGFVEDVPREPWHWTYRPAS